MNHLYGEFDAVNLLDHIYIGYSSYIPYGFDFNKDVLDIPDNMATDGFSYKFPKESSGNYLVVAYPEIVGTGFLPALSSITDEKGFQYINDWEYVATIKRYQCAYRLYVTKDITSQSPAETLTFKF